MAAAEDDVASGFPRVVELLRAAPPSFVKQLEEQWRTYFPHHAPPHFTSAYAAKADSVQLRSKSVSPVRRRPGPARSAASSPAPSGGDPGGGWPEPTPLDSVDRIRRTNGYPHTTSSKFRVFLGLERELSALEEMEEMEDAARRSRSPVSSASPAPSGPGSPPPWPASPPPLRQPPLAGPSALLRGPGTRSMPNMPQYKSLVQPGTARDEYDAVFGREAATDMLVRVLGGLRQFHLDRVAYEASRPSTPNSSLATATNNASAVAASITPRDAMLFRRMLWKYWHQLWAIYAFYTSDVVAPAQSLPPDGAPPGCERPMERVSFLSWANDLRLEVALSATVLDDAFYCASLEGPGGPAGPPAPALDDDDEDDDDDEPAAGPAAGPGGEPGLGAGRRGAHWLRKNPSFRGRKGRRRASLIGGKGASDGIFRNRRCRFLDFIDIVCRLALEIDKGFRPVGGLQTAAPPSAAPPRSGLNLQFAPGAKPGTAAPASGVLEAAAAILGRGGQPAAAEGLKGEGPRVLAAVERFLMGHVVPLSRTAAGPDARERKILLSLQVQTEAYERRRELRELYEEYAGRGRTSVRTDGGMTLASLSRMLKKRGMIRPPDPQAGEGEEGEPPPPPPDPDGPITVTEADVATCFVASVRPRLRCFPHFSRSPLAAAMLELPAGAGGGGLAGLGGGGGLLASVAEEDPKAERRRGRRERRARGSGGSGDELPEAPPLDSKLDQESFVDCVCRLALVAVGFGMEGPGPAPPAAPPSYLLSAAPSAAAGGGPSDASGQASPHGPVPTVPTEQLLAPNGPSPRTAARTSRTTAGGGGGGGGGPAIPAAVLAAFNRAADRVHELLSVLVQRPQLAMGPALARPPPPPPQPAPAAGPRLLPLAQKPKAPPLKPGEAAKGPPQGRQERPPIPVSLFGGVLVRV